MRILLLLLCVLFGLSCASKNQSADFEFTGAGSCAKSASAVANSNPAPPKDALWTIFVYTIRTPTHIADANQMKADLTRTSNMRGWYVVHQENHSVLYYGYYRSFKNSSDPKETARLQQDQKSIQAIVDALGNKPFREAMPTLINSPDPESPPEWDLRNAKGYWSLQIAAYQGSPQRKQAAVDSVREARKQGIEAYYFHGPNVSSVCIGAWPEDAIKRQDQDRAEAIDPNQPMLVLGPGTDVLGQQTKGLRDRDGERVHVVEQHIEVMDPSMQKAIRDYPTHVVNGAEEIIAMRAKDGHVVNQAKPSVIVPVPRNLASVLSPSNPDPEQPNLVAPPGDDDDLARRLRSVGGTSGQPK